ncbi:ATP-binding protein [Caballeronia sp. Sq4a]|uniref:ATP-binding protein n=1 Tax=Caballeronia sp. Sq4a TaxID=2878152 RepID=UPI0020BE6517|nr:DndE family protein [Caballeronia sp. Sq4a]
MAQFTIKDVDRMRYRPTKNAEEFLSDLRSILGLNDKASAARLALARSVCEPVRNSEEATSKIGGPDKGMPIEGIHLFGDHSDVWASIIASTVEERLDDSGSFRTLVEFHWQRGAALLQDDYNEANKNTVDFVVLLASRLPKFDGHVAGGPKSLSVGKAVSELVPIQLLTDQKPWGLNAAGGNGLMVISGRPGTGKSQLGLDLLAQAANSGARFLFFDLKGELQDSPDDSQQRENRDRFLKQTGARYIRLIDSQLPINPLVEGGTGAERAQIASEMAHLVRCFASQLGANQERVIREAYEGSAKPDIPSIVQGLKDRGEDGVALSVFDKIESFNIFADAKTAVPIEDWLSSSTVIDFKGLGNDNETKSLVVALILNTIMRQLNRQLQVVDGVQPLQMILFVDEAHLLLPKEGKAGLLGSLARQGRSWGFPVWLASQDADAFVTKGQNSTDFAQLADCGIHLSPQTLTESQQRMILGQTIHKKLGSGEGVLRLRGTTLTGPIRQYWRDAGRKAETEVLSESA